MCWTSIANALAGEPCAVKVASTVRRGAVGKAFSFARSSSLAAYPTFGTRRRKLLLGLGKGLVYPEKGRFGGTPSISPWIDHAIGVGILNGIGPDCLGKR